MKGLNGISDRTYPRPHIELWTGGVRILFVLAFIVLTVEALIPSTPSGAPMFFDKVLHFGAFFVFTGLAMLALPRTRLFHIVTAVTAYGILIEILQGSMGMGRTASLFDILANIAGTGVIAGAWIFWTRHTYRFSPDQAPNQIANSPQT